MAGRISGAAAIDGTAISLSGLCLIHCLALPIMSTALPIVGIWAEAEWLHKAFVVAALPFSAIALSSRVLNWRSGLLIIFGFLSLFAGAFVEALHDYEVELTVLGGLMLASGHMLRWRLAHSASNR